MSPTIYISALDPSSTITLGSQYKQLATPYFLLQHQLLKYYKPQPVHLCTKTTHSTTLATKHFTIPAPDTISQQFQKYHSVFNKRDSHRLPKHQPWDHTIDLKPNSTMKKCGVYRLTPAKHLALKDYIQEHLAKGYIHPSKSPIASPFFFIAKKGGNLRPVQDYRALNDITVKNATPLPLIPELIDKLQGSRYFTKFDVRWGYNNIRIKEGDEWKAAFKCSLGLFKPLVMTFGLCNAPTTFQAFMNSIFSDLIDNGHLVVYLDNILIFHSNLSDLHTLTHDVLSRLAKNDLYLKPEKCFFDKTSIEYIGVIISEGRIKMDPTKISGITQWPVPKKLKDLQSFLGFCNFYCRFIEHYSAIARPLFALCKKETPYTWTRD